MADVSRPDQAGSVLIGRLTRAFDDLLARDHPPLGRGVPGYYGVRLENIAQDGSELGLVVTLRAGETYCCSQSSCHFDFGHATIWSELRGDMDAQGLRELPLPRIRRLRVVVEAGALFDPGGLRSTSLESRGYVYEEGPFPPVIGPDEQGWESLPP